MKQLLCGALAALFFVTTPAQAEPGDDRVIAAREAYRVGDRAALDRLAATAHGHPLDIYIEYWRIKNRFDEASGSEIRAFLERHPDTFLADRLRAEWLKRLGKGGDWERFDSQFSLLDRADAELGCYALASRLARKDNSALDAARAMWLDMVDLPAPCNPVMDKLVSAGRLSEDDIWTRIRRQLEAKRLGGALAAGAYLQHAPQRVELASLMADPARHLHRQKANYAATRTGRELAMVALARLARSDPQAAAGNFETVKPRLSGNERAYVYMQLGWAAAQRHMPEALAWYRAGDDAPMTDDQAAWYVRAALRAGNWRAVRAAIAALPPRLVDEPAWIYWSGRAEQALGHTAEAHAAFERAAGPPTFYGILAAEEIGRVAALPPKASALTPAELAAAQTDMGLTRALALFGLDLRLEGIREWNWALKGRDDRFLLAAAELARRHDLFDRAINTADRTVGEHDYSLRYLAPFRDRVEPKARELDLDHAWVYGLMRQESRFVMNARSSAGASGLMQLMPATARWVARKIGLKNFRLSEVNDMDTNVVLGTSYLKMVLSDLDNHPVLASAAYNAGPGRARRWRDGRPLEGAIYAETIPFDETRDYVKKVMANSVYYAAVFGAAPVPLKTRLGMIAPRSGAGNTELP